MAAGLQLNLLADSCRHSPVKAYLFFRINLLYQVLASFASLLPHFMMGLALAKLAPARREGNQR